MPLSVWVLMFSVLFYGGWSLARAPPKLHPRRLAYVTYIWLLTAKGWGWSRRYIVSYCCVVNNCLLLCYSRATVFTAGAPLAAPQSAVDQLMHCLHGTFVSHSAQICAPAEMFQS